MTEAFTIMIIWFGAGKYAQFDVQRFENMTECQSAKMAIVSEYADSWSPISSEDIRCREIQP